ncbi:MAG: sulfatase-like hydrolase/transferase, partial [Solirubrobacterales bacterium]
MTSLSPTARFRLPIFATATFLCALAVAFFWLAESKAMAATRPNVVLIQVDDMAKSQMRAEIGEPGTWRPAMPNVLDLIGGQGVELTRYYSSNPICGPSRASLLTGLATHNHRMRTNSLTKGYPVWQGGPHFHENLPVWLQR